MTSSSAPRPATLHGTAVAVEGRAVLIRGASGSGKSDLALRAIAMGPSGLLPASAALVADDRVIVEPRNGALMISAPTVLKGLLEVRGIGIVNLDATDEARLVLVADLTEGESIERLPEEGETTEILPGWPVPRVRIAPFEASAAAKLLLALSRAGL